MRTNDLAPWSVTRTARPGTTASHKSRRLPGSAGRAVLAYADTMTRDIAVPDDVFAALKQDFNDRQIVELTVLIGTYNMNARVLRALELDLEPAAD